jgi:hypothetical protein
MNLIDKYVAEVGKHLPRQKRADIQAEIRSTLEDMLDERKPGQGPAEEALVLQLLKEYGAPRDVAATYKTHPYLIGPRLFPIFEMVLRIVSAVFIGASLLGLGVNLVKDGFTGPAFLSALGGWFTGLISGLIAAFGNIVLVFAILERTQAGKKIEGEFKEWDPAELKKEPDPDLIDLPDHIFTIIFTFLGLVVLNLYPNLLSIRFLKDGAWIVLPILTSVFFSYLPWINIMSLLQIGFNSFMLGQKSWSPITRSFGLVLDVAGMLLAVVILKTPGVFGITPAILAALGSTDDAETIAQFFNTLPTLILTIVIIVTAIKVIKTLLRLFSGKSNVPYPVLK